jgi:antitoxin component YwqK of YwqJK toxin-antitoxin module
LRKWIIILLFPTTVLAQERVITDTIYLDKNWNETGNRNEAVYYRGAWYNNTDSTWLVHDYYLETFTIQMIGIYKGKVKPQNQTGEFKYYYKNGNLRAIYNFSGGYMNGESILFFENGTREVKRTFKQGQLTDTLFFNYENGKPKEILCVNVDFDPENLAEAEKEFKLISYWNTQGEAQVTNGSGTRIEYYPNGIKRQSIEYENGFPDGEWIQYNEKKKVISKMTFKNGKFISGLMYPKKKKDIFATLYREPRFPGGIKAIDDFVLKNTGKCREAIKSEITIMINISENGEPQFEQIISGDVSHCQYDELEELVKKMPKWNPAVRYGRYVESTYVIRVRY